jgi:hypothetical protein
MTLKDGKLSDGRPDDGIVGNVPIPDELLREMTEEERNLILSGKGLADDTKIFESPLGGLSVVAIRAGEEVCQYCFRRFNETERDGRSIEIYTKNPETGELGGTRTKVHGVCHDRANPM